MQIAIVVYDRFTALDAVGPYEVLARAPGAETVFVSLRPGPVRADRGVSRSSPSGRWATYRARMSWWSRAARGRAI